MTKVSIIIPIYNGEKYLKQCLNSVLSQTLKALEVICVDDGSIDHSAQIIQSFMQSDERIVFLQQENKGAGAARNLALKNAKGKYVAFLDADDFYIDEDALALMYSLCETKNVSACASLRKHIKAETEEPDKLFDKVNKNVVLDYQDFQIDYNYQDFLFLHSLLEKNQIYFPDYRRFQDPPFLVKALYAAKRFAIADTYLYGYRVSDMLPRFCLENTCDLLQGLIDNLTFAIRHNLDSLFEKTRYRLEYEYARIILSYISSGTLYILELLVKANRMICEKMEDFNYIIRPLRGLLFYTSEYEEKLLQKIRKEKKIVLYGAGWLGKIFLSYLKKNYLIDNLSAFVVSDVRGNEEKIEEIPVLTLQELEDKKIYILVVVGENYQAEVEKELKKNNYENYEIVKDEFLLRIFVQNC